MIDKERVTVLLATLEDYLKELRQKTGLSLEKYKKDQDRQRITERMLQLISETELDVAEELYKGLGLKLSESERSMISSLEEPLGKETIAGLLRRRSLRNQLVHTYRSYNQDEVFEQADKTKDVEAFINTVKKVLKQR